MPIGPVDPAALEGADLLQWYRRSPWDIEQERLDARRRQYNDFFGIDPNSNKDGETSDEGAPDDSLNVTSGGSQTPLPSWLPALSFEPIGYAPGLLGDLSRLSQPQVQGGVPSAAAPQPMDDARHDQSQVQSAADATPAGSAPNGGAVLDGSLWPTGSSPTLMPVSTRQRPASPSPAGRQTPAPTQPGPTVSLRPSDGFFSWLFGGPVPIKDSAGATTGYYDHQAANAGLKIIGAYAGVAPIFQPGSWAGDLLSEIAPGAAEAISEGIDEAIANHHPWPKYLGGPQDQELAPLRDSLHKAFHSQLGAAMRQEGFPPVGGLNGSTPKMGGTLRSKQRQSGKSY